MFSCITSFVIFHLNTKFEAVQYGYYPQYMIIFNESIQLINYTFNLFFSFIIHPSSFPKVITTIYHNMVLRHIFVIQKNTSNLLSSTMLVFSSCKLNVPTHLLYILLSFLFTNSYTFTIGKRIGLTNPDSAVDAVT